MSHKFKFSSIPRQHSRTPVRIKGSNRHNQPDRDELPEFEKFPKGSHAARRQRREERLGKDK